MPHAAPAPLLLTLASLLCLLAAGCSAMLPKSRTVTQSPWGSYRDAQLTFDKIIPGQTTSAELRDLQLDPEANPNISILNYSEVLTRFMPNASIRLDDLDTGVRDCISAKTQCRGYAVQQKTTVKNREGNFFADVLGFDRETHTTGWCFNGLLLVKDGVVIYKLTSGQPNIVEHENVKNPLGPVMGLGQKIFGIF
ncbi:MAG: hypothetical protein JO035_15365 [Betaproteobacteria bacterium]|nr:hypothetical protein [Betaproteobacteria bacterium]